MKAVFQVEVDYNEIRKIVCLMNGELWDDEKIKELLGEDITRMDSSVLGENEEEVTLLFATLILVKKLQEK